MNNDKSSMSSKLITKKFDFFLFFLEKISSRVIREVWDVCGESKRDLQVTASKACLEVAKFSRVYKGLLGPTSTHALANLSV